MSVGLTYARVGGGDVSAASPAFLLGLGPPGRTRIENEEPPTSLALSASGASHPLAIDVLAPGLFAVRSASPLSAGSHDVGGVRNRIRLQLVSAAPPPAPSAPRVTSIRRSLGRRAAPRLEAQLAEPVPRGVVAVVVTYEGRGVAWRAVGPGERDDVDVASGRGCSDLPVGYEVPVEGSRVALRFVDATGQLSPPSALVTID